MRHAETALNAAWIAIGLGIAAASWRTGLWDASGPGSGFLGLIAGAVIALAGGALLGSAAPARGYTIGRDAARRILAVIAALCAMAVLMPMLGFIVTAIPTLVVLSRFIERQSWAVIVGFSTASTLIVYWIFDRLLGATLPSGVLGF